MSEAFSNNAGYRKKPLWIYMVAIALMVAPLGNLLWTLANLNIPRWYLPSTWRIWLPYLTASTWVMLAALFVSGCSLLFVRRWSWGLGLLTLCLITVYNLVMLKQFLMLGPIAVFLMIASTIGLAAFLYFSEFRKPYLNPRLRWWETSPRFRAELPVALQGQSEPAILVDISRTGLLLEWPEGKKPPGLEGTLHLTLPAQSQSVPGEVKRSTLKGYGLQFENLTKPDKRLIDACIGTLADDPTKVGR